MRKSSSSFNRTNYLAAWYSLMTRSGRHLRFLVALRRLSCPRDLPMGSAILQQRMKRSMQLRKRQLSHGFRRTYSEITIT